MPSYLGKVSKIPRRLTWVLVGGGFFAFSDWLFKKECYRVSLQYIPQFPIEVRRAIETGDSRYLFMFDLKDSKINAYNQENKKFLY